MSREPVRRLCIIQARTGSSRLPAKVLEPLCGDTVLGVLLTRLRPMRSADRIVVATTDEARDDRVEAIATAHGVAAFRGSEDNVLDRFYRCAATWPTRSIIRLTADNPCVDAELVDNCSAEFDRGTPVDYLGIEAGTLPYGLSVEMCSFAALSAAWHETKDPYDLEHVTPFIRNRPDRFPSRNYSEPGLPGDGRVTIDTPEDLANIRRLDERTGGRLIQTGYREIARLASREAAGA